MSQFCCYLKAKLCHIVSNLESFPVFACHAGFDLLDSSWDVVCQVLTAVLSHEDVVFDSNATDFLHVLTNFLKVHILEVEFEEFLRSLTRKQELSEVAAWLNRHYVV